MPTIERRRELGEIVRLEDILLRSEDCDAWLAGSPERHYDAWSVEHYTRLYHDFSQPFRWFVLRNLDGDGPIRAERHVRGLYIWLVGKLLMFASEGRAEVEALRQQISAEIERQLAESRRFEGDGDGLYLGNVLRQVARILSLIRSYLQAFDPPKVLGLYVLTAGGRTENYAPLN